MSLPNPDTAETFQVPPAVDISSYTSERTIAARAETARQLDVACSTVGFIQVLGHGIPPADVLVGLSDAVDAFFAMPLHLKKSYIVEGNRGYTPPEERIVELEPRTGICDTDERLL